MGQYQNHAHPVSGETSAQPQRNQSQNCQFHEDELQFVGGFVVEESAQWGTQELHDQSQRKHRTDL